MQGRVSAVGQGARGYVISRGYRIYLTKEYEMLVLESKLVVVCAGCGFSTAHVFIRHRI